MSSLQTRLLLAVGAIALTAVATVAIAARHGTRLEFLRFQEFERRTALAGAPDRAREVVQRLGGRCCDGRPTLRDAVSALPPSQAALVIDNDNDTVIDMAGHAVQMAGSGIDVARSGAGRLMPPVTFSRDGPLLTLEFTRQTGATVNHIALKLLQHGEPLRLTDGRAATLYVVPFPSEERERHAAAFLGSLDRRLLVATSLVGVLALLLTWTLARNTVRPIAELGAASRDLARGVLSRRVEPRGTNEVVALARAFNGMAADLERQHVLRQSLLHDVAHELRTPLTALRCRVESVLDGLSPDPARAMADVREEVVHLGRLVDDLQELALAEARELRLDLADMRLSAIVASAVRAAGLDNDPRLRVEVAGELMARGDPGRVRQVVLNLLTNADRYTPADGSITVRGSIEGSQASIEVRNTGSTLDDEQIARLFDRFYRTDPSRQRAHGGTGLGLAIVKHLVEAQGGRVWARADTASVTVGFALSRGA